MIISASRRTDIPAFYADWFIEQIKAKYCYVNGDRIDLSPDNIDCIVFWTKNATSLYNRIEELKDYTYYFQYTVTGYEKDIEPNLDKEESIETFKKLSDKIGKEKVIWRYDPILLNSKYTPNYHLYEFNKLCLQLKDYTEKVIISFIDTYPKLLERCKDLNLLNPIGFNYEPATSIALEMKRIAEENNLQIESCAEFLNTIKHGHCIDKERIERISGKELNIGKDITQRQLCGCCTSIDIGWYNTCKHGCRYCYACK